MDSSEESESSCDQDSSDDDDMPQMTEPTPQPQKLLYEGATPGLTECMAHLLLFRYSVKNSLTARALQELLDLMTVFLPADSGLSRSITQLKNYFLSIFSEQQPEMKDYCTMCHHLLTENDKCTCNAKLAQFVTVPIGPQLKSRLEGRWIVIPGYYYWLLLCMVDAYNYLAQIVWKCLPCFRDILYHDHFRSKVMEGSE